MQNAIAEALRDFADSVKAKVTANAPGEAEAQLSAPVSVLIERFGKIIHRNVVAKAESNLGNRLGIPDFAVLADRALCGYLELKAPREGADTSRYRGRNKEQWERFKSQPNILYTDGNEWCVYQNGEPAERLLRFSKDITRYGGRAIAEGDAEHFRSIVTKLLAWSPIVPKKPKEQAALLAPLCRLLRQDVAEALENPDSPLVNLKTDWRSLLFPDASDDQFADAYAQTVTFALLLARSEGADVSEISNAVDKLEAGHTLLSRALQVLTDANARKEIRSSLHLLQRVIQAFPTSAMKPAEADPWLYFYEHFLSAYDPKLRKDTGVYYTPVEVVKCQVALVDALLRGPLARRGGLVHKDVIILDPAVGTGTYLLGVVDHALARVAEEEGAGSVKARASALAANLYGFEIMVGPYAVSELRLTRDLKERGGSLPAEGLGVYLADALESPHGKPPRLPQFFEPIAEQHRRALEVKDKKSVIVCIGNPPYDRHAALGESTAANRARTGGWVRWGDSGNPDLAIFNAFVQPAKDAGHGGDVKNLYNLYAYFLRWGLWKVFESKTAKLAGNQGVVSFITAASYLRGDAFVGVREMLRRLCDDVWVIDLGGEGRGTRQDENVFNIQTPVAILIAMCKGNREPNKPASVKYTRIRETRDEKLFKLSTVRRFEDLKWKLCPTDWHAPLRPKGTGTFFAYPNVADLMPWQSSGAQLKRIWPIGPSQDVLERRWKTLLTSDRRDKAFKESRDRKVSGRYPLLPGVADFEGASKAIENLPTKTPCASTRRYGYRSFDRHWIIADNRVGDYMRTALWCAHGERQIYLVGLFSLPLGNGPALVSSASIPDMDMFRGSFGARACFPLYRDSAATEPNIVPGLLAIWGKKLRRPIMPEDFAAYIYAMLAHPAYVDRFYDELEDQEVRVPLTLDAKLFNRAIDVGSKLLFLHTYGERFTGKGRRRGEVPRGKARSVKAISDKPADYPNEFSYDGGSRTLRVGTGAIAPVDPGVWDFEVSGLRVVDSWLGYRMKDRKGKKSSPLDEIHPERWTAEFTEELLKLLWIVEQTIAMQSDLADLLAKVCAGPLLPAADLPTVPDAMRGSPRAGDREGLFDSNGDEEAEEEDDE